VALLQLKTAEIIYDPMAAGSAVASRAVSTAPGLSTTFRLRHRGQKYSLYVR
jgi:hypothetical protein